MRCAGRMIRARVTRRRAAAAIAAIAFVLLYAPLLKPLWQGGVFLLDLYSTALIERNLAALVTPAPIERSEFVELDGLPIRIDWWRPGWGDRHPAVVLVNGAVALGNDEPNVRRTAEGLSRAGYLVMMTELPGAKALRIDPRSPAQILAAVRHVRGLPYVDPVRVGLFGLSVGAALALVAAAEPELHDLAYVAGLSPFFSAEGMIVNVVTQSVRDGDAVLPWRSREDIRVGVQQALARTLSDPAEAEELAAVIDAMRGDVRGDPYATWSDEARAVWAALVARERPTAERLVRELPAAIRDALAPIDPSRSWSAVRAPVYLIHSPADDAEPVTESYAALRAPRAGVTKLLAPDLLHHGELVSERARREGPLFFAREISGMLAFAIEVLRVAG